MISEDQIIHAPRRATTDDAAVLARVIADAFHLLHISTWLVPSARERTRILPRYFTLLVDHAMLHGTVHTIANREAVAVWLPAGVPDLPEIDNYDENLRRACGGHADRFRALDQVMHAHHPTEPAHEYLALLAVHPSRQNQGVGSYLLRARHHDLDRAGRPAYLEASSIRSRDLYRRHGYQPIAAPFAPNSAVAAMWPMWREPRHPDDQP